MPIDYITADSKETSARRFLVGYVRWLAEEVWNV